MTATTEFHPAAPATRDLRQRAGLGAGARYKSAAGHSRAYSRFVNLMKFLLPVVALAVIALVVAWPHINTGDLRFRLGVTVLKLTGAEEPSMINPRYVGTDSDNQPFSITADLARSMGGTNAAETYALVMPKADITLEDGTWLVLTANDGIYSRNGRTLGLEGEVNLYHDSGYEFRTTRASIDLAAGVAEGNDPVNGQGPFGQLRASGFRVASKGNVIYFLGKSKLTLYPGAKPPAR